MLHCFAEADLEAHVIIFTFKDGLNKHWVINFFGPQKEADLWTPFKVFNYDGNEDAYVDSVTFLHS
mgnify:CR=1 FL=1